MVAGRHDESEWWIAYEHRATANRWAMMENRPCGYLSSIRPYRIGAIYRAHSGGQWKVPIQTEARDL